MNCTKLCGEPWHRCRICQHVQVLCTWKNPVRLPCLNKCSPRAPFWYKYNCSWSNSGFHTSCPRYIRAGDPSYPIPGAAYAHRDLHFRLLRHDLVAPMCLSVHRFLEAGGVKSLEVSMSVTFVDIYFYCARSGSVVLHSISCKESLKRSLVRGHR